MHDFAAVVFVLVLLLTPLLAIAIGLWRSPFTMVQTLLYWGAILLVRMLWRVEVRGRLEFRDGRGAVVVANHRSSVDPFFLQTLTRRKMHWLVAKEFFAHPLFGWFLRTVESIPTSRAGLDTAAIREAIRYCEQGDPIGMLPEGRINATEQPLLPVRPGAILIAARAKAVVIPCYLEGVPFDRAPWSPLVMPARVVITIGQPIELNQAELEAGGSEAMEAATLRVMKEVARLGGRGDFEPILAGRNWKPTTRQVEADFNARDRRRPR